MDFITSLTSQVLNKAMDGLSQRHKAIAGNLANVDTPGYRRRDVSFESSLERAIEKSRRQENAPELRMASNDAPLSMRVAHPAHINLEPPVTSVDDVRPQIVESEDVQIRNDGNGVDVETEMVQLARNTQRYQALTNIQARFNRSLKSVITNGGG